MCVRAKEPVPIGIPIPPVKARFTTHRFAFMVLLNSYDVTTADGVARDDRPTPDTI